MMVQDIYSRLILPDDVPTSWQALGVRSSANGMGDIRGIRFEDINGDVSFKLSIPLPCHRGFGRFG